MNRAVSPLTVKHALGELAPHQTGTVATKAAALVSVALIPTTYLNVGALPIGVAVGALFALAWSRTLFSSRSLTILSAIVALMALGGLFLLATNAQNQFQPTVTASLFALLLKAVVTLGVVAWSLRRVGLPWTAIAFGSGGVVNGLLATDAIDQPWKYLYSAPVAITLLGVAAMSRRAWPAIVAALIVMLVSAANSYRSLSVIIAISSVLWLILRATRTSRAGALKARTIMMPAILVAVTGLLAVDLVPRLLLSGALGEAARVNTEQQLLHSGEAANLLLGGRVEPVASLALFQVKPLGYGPGAIPSNSDAVTVGSAYSEAGVTPSLQYVFNYMLGGQFKLHSIVGDLWINFGLAGLAFSFAAITILIRFLVATLTMRNLPLLPITLMVWAVWDLLFSPIYSNLTQTLFTLAICALVPIREQRQEVGPVPARKSSPERSESCST